MTSPYILPYEGRGCTEQKCPPFYIREWETMLVGTFIAAVLVYLAYSCGPEYFQAFAARATTQKMLTVDDRPHRSFITAETFADPPAPAGTVLRGAGIPTQGVSTEKFTEFARVDNIDNLGDEQNPSHRPAKSDAELSAIAY